MAKFSLKKALSYPFSSQGPSLLPGMGISKSVKRSRYGKYRRRKAGKGGKRGARGRKKAKYTLATCAMTSKGKLRHCVKISRGRHRRKK